MGSDIKQQVSEFYNQIGWQEVGDGGECRYQNAQYEDLRPVSREYIHKCHQRVARHLTPVGKYLLDAGSGPIQYPEYLEYSKGYQRRVCADISVVALQEARKRIGDAASGGHGLFVVCDIANLPFKQEVFDGMVSLHAIHHLTDQEHPRAYEELHRVLAVGHTGVIVNGWDSASLAQLADGLVRLVANWRAGRKDRPATPAVPSFGTASHPTGTFVRKHNATWLKRVIGSHIPFRIWVWRSVNVHFLRTFVHERWGGRFWLRVLYWLEERFPHFLGKNGQYPLIVIQKRQAIP